MGLLTDITKRLQTTITANPTFANIPVEIFEFDIDTLVQTELAKCGLGVIINFCEIVNEISSFKTTRDFNYSGTIDVYEIPTLNRNQSTYYTAVDTAEAIAALLMNDDLSDINLTIFHINSVRFMGSKPITTGSDQSMIQWRVTYSINREFTDAQTT